MRGMDLGPSLVGPSCVERAGVRGSAEAGPLIPTFSPLRGEKGPEARDGFFAPGRCAAFWRARAPSSRQGGRVQAGGQAARPSRAGHQARPPGAGRGLVVPGRARTTWPRTSTSCWPTGEAAQARGQGDGAHLAARGVPVLRQGGRDRLRALARAGHPPRGRVGCRPSLPAAGRVDPRRHALRDAARADSARRPGGGAAAADLGGQRGGSGGNRGAFAGDAAALAPAGAAELHAWCPSSSGRCAMPTTAELAAALAEIVDQHTLVVASSDFTHRGDNYGYEVPAGKGTIQERLAAVDDGSVSGDPEAQPQAGSWRMPRRPARPSAACSPSPCCSTSLSRFPGVRGQVASRYTSGDVTKRLVEHGDLRRRRVYWQLAQGFEGRGGAGRGRENVSIERRRAGHAPAPGAGLAGGVGAQGVVRLRRFARPCP